MIVITDDEFVIEKTGALIENIIVRFWVKAARIHVLLKSNFFNLVFDYETHIAEWESQELPQYHPILIFSIESKTFIKKLWVSKILVLYKVKILEWEGLDGTVLVGNNNFIAFYNIHQSSRIPQNLIRLWNFKELQFVVILHIPK